MDYSICGRRKRSYLDDMVNIGLLTKHKLGRENYYLNDALYGGNFRIDKDSELLARLRAHLRRMESSVDDPHLESPLGIQ